MWSSLSLIAHFVFGLVHLGEEVYTWSFDLGLHIDLVGGLTPGGERVALCPRRLHYLSLEASEVKK